MVSIIITAYNVEKYIKECIESVINQTYRDIEIIIINDGSTDKTGGICASYAKIDHRIVVYNKENAGISAARNLGLSVAKGEYILFTDADDYMDCKMVEFMVAAIKDNDVVICRECAFKDGADPKNNLVTNEEYTLSKVENRNELISHFADEFTGPVGWPWNKLYKRKLIGESRFIEGKLMEDLFFNSTVLINVNKAVWISDRLYYYRQRSGSIMNSKNKRVFLDYSEALVYQRKKFYPILSDEEKSRMASYYLRKTYRLIREAKKGGFIKEKDIIKENFKKLYKEDMRYVKGIKDIAKIRLYYMSCFFC